MRQVWPLRLMAGSRAGEPFGAGQARSSQQSLAGSGLKSGRQPRRRQPHWIAEMVAALMPLRENRCLQRMDSMPGSELLGIGVRGMLPVLDSEGSVNDTRKTGRTGPGCTLRTRARKAPVSKLATASLSTRERP